MAVFTTQERADLSTSFMVVGAETAKLKPFRREALFVSILQACGHRHQPIEDALELTETVIQKLPFSKQGTITTQAIALTTLHVLSRFDAAAATYYRAYYMNHS